MKVFVNGAANIKMDQYGTIRTGFVKLDRKDLFQIENLKAVFTKKSSRFGRFDHYTRLGCAAVGLALSEAGFDPQKKMPSTGFILAGQFGSFVTDIEFFNTMCDGGGFASPHLFSYTLPNIVIGECAHQFGFMGPTFCLDSNDGWGSQALCSASVYLRTHVAEAMLVGWIEVLPDQAPRGKEGAVVLYIGKKASEDGLSLELEAEPLCGMRFMSGEAVNSLDELLQHLRISDSDVC